MVESVINLYCKFRSTTRKNKTNKQIRLICREGKRKWNHIKCSIKTRGGRKKGKTKKKNSRITNRKQFQIWYILIITLNMNGLNTLIKRQRLSEQIKTKKNTPDPTIFCVLKTKSI